jgi:uncharacterized protein
MYSKMIETLTNAWPWYIAGPLIGLMVPALLLIGNKQFGISSTFRDFCALTIPNRFDYFNYSLKEHLWRNILVLGVVIGGFLAVWLLDGGQQVNISEQTAMDLNSLGIENLTGLVPHEIFSWKSLATSKGLILIILGGFLVGFGTRWADGCTAGHAITGLALFSPASLISVFGFFAGGLVSTHFLLPLILH